MISKRLKKARSEMNELSRFIECNKRNAKCLGPCPGVTAYFDELVQELRSAGEPCLI